MNCKEGDLAIVIRSKCGNEGKIVRCVKYLGEIRLVSINLKVSDPTACWHIEPPLIGVFGKIGNGFPDRDLKPIRNSDGEDETLSWKTLETA